jgi:hypothetical protein
VLARWWAAVALAAATASGAQCPSPDIARVLAEGEQLLAAGDAASAEAAFDRAAAAVHEHDVEMSLVRAYVQAGDYRRALAFAAHAAGAHGHAPAASALYAWLLTTGGQRRVARQLLARAVGTSPDDSLLEHAATRLSDAWPIADGPLLHAPARFAPYASGATAVGKVAASALLSADGQRALAPSYAVPDEAELWVRNGVGRTVAAKLERRLDTAGVELAVLALQSTLPAPSDVVAAARMPFAGSVGYASEFAPLDNAEAQWPLITLGFFGRNAGAGELPQLGIALPPGPRGGPVFDAAGRVAGLTMRGRDGSARLVPLEWLPEDLRSSFGTPSLGGPTPRSALDVIYERGLLLTLQLIVNENR